MAKAKEAKWHARPTRYKRDRGGVGAAGGVGGKSGWYVWRVPPDFSSRTRPEHLRLNGRKFRWDDPPVINARTGERGHPGHDGHCRCFAEPVEGE